MRRQRWKEAVLKGNVGSSPACTSITWGKCLPREGNGSCQPSENRRVSHFAATEQLSRTSISLKAPESQCGVDGICPLPCESRNL